MDSYRPTLAAPSLGYARDPAPPPGGVGRWRRRAAIVVALAALVPLEQTRRLTNGSSSGGVGRWWSYTYQSAVHRPLLTLALSVATLWLTAAALWTARTRPVVQLAGLAATATTVVVAVALATAAPARTVAVTRQMAGRIPLGTTESAVIAKLGQAPDLGTATRLYHSAISLPCLVYNAPGWFQGGVVFCFRHSRLAVKQAS